MHAAFDDGCSSISVSNLTQTNCVCVERDFEICFSNVRRILVNFNNLTYQIEVNTYSSFLRLRSEFLFKRRKTGFGISNWNS